LKSKKFILKNYYCSWPTAYTVILLNKKLRQYSSQR